MHEKQLATCPIITTLCCAILRPAILEKDNPSDSSILITVQPQCSWESPSFLPLPSTKSDLLRKTSESQLIVVVPNAFHHPDLLGN